MQQPPENWHLDKRVPVAIILAIAMQSATAIWWASSVSQRITQVEQAQAAAGNRSERADATLADQGQRLAVLQEAVANTNRNLERLQGEIASTNDMLRELLSNRIRGANE